MSVSSNTNTSKHIDFEKIANFRDLGGIKTASGKRIQSNRLYRSSDLHEASEKDLSTLKEMGVSDIVDLRMSVESKKNPDRLQEDWHLHVWPVFEFDASGFPAKSESSNENNEKKQVAGNVEQAQQLLGKIYPIMLHTKPAITTWRRFFDLLLSNPSGVIYHCTEGKDRTGIATLLTLAALGADQETMKADYLKTDHFMKRILDQHARRHETGLNEGEESQPVFLGVLPEYYEILEKSVAPYGGWMGYLKNVLQLSDEDIARLRENYLEDE